MWSRAREAKAVGLTTALAARRFARRAAHRPHTDRPRARAPQRLGAPLDSGELVSGLPSSARWPSTGCAPAGVEWPSAVV